MTIEERVAPFTLPSPARPLATAVNSVGSGVGGLRLGSGAPRFEFAAGC